MKEGQKWILPLLFFSSFSCLLPFFPLRPLRSLLFIFLYVLTFFKAIPYPKNRFNVDRCGRVRLNFGAKVANVNVNGAL